MTDSTTMMDTQRTHWHAHQAVSRKYIKIFFFGSKQYKTWEYIRAYVCMAKTFELDDDSMRRINCKRKRKKRERTHTRSQDPMSKCTLMSIVWLLVSVCERAIVCGYREKGNQMKNMHSIQVKIITVIDLAIVVAGRMVLVRLAPVPLFHSLILSLRGITHSIALLTFRFSVGFSYLAAVAFDTGSHTHTHSYR